PEMYRLHRHHHDHARAAGREHPDMRGATGAKIGRVTVDEISDRLYALPPEEFTQARNLAERELRAAGQREQADQVKALRKPTAGAGAVNRLVHGHRAEVDAFLEAAARLRDAQFAGKGELAAAADAERAALEELVALGGEPGGRSRPLQSTTTSHAI